METIEIKGINGALIFKHTQPNNTIKETLKEAIKLGICLKYIDLSNTDLEGMNLGNLNLICSDFFQANLKNTDFRGSELRSIYLNGANITGSNLEPIKQDMFLLLSHAKDEIPNLKKAIEKGKIDGSTYEGECACLCGTLEKSTNQDIVNKIFDLRNNYRPIERFFLPIKEGDTPETNQFSKRALEWIEEFEKLNIDHGNNNHITINNKHNI